MTDLEEKFPFLNIKGEKTLLTLQPQKKKKMIHVVIFKESSFWRLWVKAFVGKKNVNNKDDSFLW